MTLLNSQDENAERAGRATTERKGDHKRRNRH
jgi:hypothetical protein